MHVVLGQGMAIQMMHWCTLLVRRNCSAVFFVQSNRVVKESWLLRIPAWRWDGE